MMGKWLDRLKNEKAPGTPATKPTKPTQGTHEGGFVGSVAYPPACLQKNNGGDQPAAAAETTTEALPQAHEEPAASMGHAHGLVRIEAERLAALQPWPQTQADTDTVSAWWLLHYPDRDPVQLVSHPPATLAQILQQHPEAMAAEPMSEPQRYAPHPAPHLTAEADLACWPHTSAMNSVEIDTFTARLGRFTDKGMAYDQAEALADKLVQRDREGDDRRLCLECRHLQGAGRWRCGNWHQAGVAREGLARDLVLMLQRCDGYHPAMQAQALSQTQQAQPKEHPHD